MKPTQTEGIEFYHRVLKFEYYRNIAVWTIPPDRSGPRMSKCTSANRSPLAAHGIWRRERPADSPKLRISLDMAEITGGSSLG